MKALTEHFKEYSEHPVHFGRLELEDWVEQGKPHCMVKAEEARGFEVWIDVRYGNVFLSKNDKVIAWGTLPIVTNEIAVLSKGYHNVHCYLWFPAFDNVESASTQKD